MNEKAIAIITAVVVVIGLIVYTTGQNKAIRYEMASLKKEFDEYKERNDKYMRMLLTRTGFISYDGEEIEGTQQMPRQIHRQMPQRHISRHPQHNGHDTHHNTHNTHNTRNTHNEQQLGKMVVEHKKATIEEMNEEEEEKAELSQEDQAEINKELEKVNKELDQMNENVGEPVEGEKEKKNEEKRKKKEKSPSKKDE